MVGLNWPLLPPGAAMERQTQVAPPAAGAATRLQVQVLPPMYSVGITAQHE